MTKQNAAALWVLWCPFWFYVPASEEEGRYGNVKCSYGPGWFLGSFGCCVSPASTRRFLLCVVGVQILHKLNSSEMSEKHVPISFKYCIPWGKMLEVASFSTAVTLQYVTIMLTPVWVSCGVCKMYCLLLLAPCPAELVTCCSHAAPLLGLLPPYVRRCWQVSSRCFWGYMAVGRSCICKTLT